MPRSADTRTKILEIAETEFAGEGYAGAHLQKIAEQVGVRKTALYYYFDSKSALYTAVLETILREFDRVVTSAVEGPGGHAERLERLVGDLNDLLAEHPNYARILIRIFVDRPQIEPDHIVPLLEHVIGRALHFYREGADAGVFQRLSSRHLFQSTLGMILFHYATRNFAARILGVEDIFTHPTVAWRRDEVMRLLSHGVLADPAAEPDADESD